MSAKELIFKRLSDAPYALAVFELHIFGVSENAAATRLSELQRDGKVVGVYRPGKRYKEWAAVRTESNGQIIMNIGIAA